MRHLAPRVRRDRRGTAGLEFALWTTPILFVSFVCADVVQLGRGYLRAQNAAMQIGQIISQCERVNGNDIALLGQLAPLFLGSYASGGAQWRMVISAFGRDNTSGTQQNIAWSQPVSGGAASGGAPALDATSKQYQLPAGYQTGQNRLLFRTEIFVSVDRTSLTRRVWDLVSRTGITAV